jgi:hypothetical protein
VVAMGNEAKLALGCTWHVVQDIRRGSDDRSAYDTDLSQELLGLICLYDRGISS